MRSKDVETITQSQAGRIDVPYVAHLARVHLTEAEVREFQGQFDQIIGYFNELRELDVSGVEPTAHAVEVRNVFRKDEPRESLSREAVLANAPVTGVVPKILE